MNWKTTLALALIMGALFAYIRLYDAKQPGTRDAAEQGSRVLGKLDRDKVDSLVITRGETRIDLRRDPAPKDTTTPPPTAPDDAPPPSRWRLHAPLADRADGTVIDTLLTGLDTLRKESTVPVPGAAADKSKLAAYGLQNPRLRLKLTGKGGVDTELLFGNETPIEGKTYVALANGRDEIYAVADTLRRDLEKPPADFRDQNFTDLPASDVTKLSIKNPAGTLELVKEGSGWRLLKPMVARAADEKISELVTRLADLRATGFLPDDKTADTAAHGLAEPRGTLTLATAETPPRVAELVIGKPVEPPALPRDPTAPAGVTPLPPPLPGPPALYARAAGRPGVLTAPRTVEDFLNLKPADLRDRALARLNPDTVDRIRLRPITGPEITFSRAKGQEKGWTLREGGGGPERPAHAGEVERLLSRLPTQNVSAFIADTAGELPKYGLDQPILRVAFASIASETTAEGAAGETVLATVEFGKPVDGSGVNNVPAAVYARLAEEPFIVSLDKAALDAIPTDPLAWQAPEIFKTDPDTVRSLTSAPPNAPEVALDRADAKSPWKLTRGGGSPDAAAATAATPEPTRAQTVANTLARLRAVRWIGATRPEHGLEAPAAGTAVTISFGTAAAAAAPGTAGAGGGKLLIGNRSPDGMWYARVEGRPGTFLLSAPDHAALTQALLASGAPTSATAPPPPAR